jgi:hypothetical protein
MRAFERGVWKCEMPFRSLAGLVPLKKDRPSGMTPGPAGEL